MPLERLMSVSTLLVRRLVPFVADSFTFAVGPKGEMEERGRAAHLASDGASRRPSPPGARF